MATIFAARNGHERFALDPDLAPTERRWYPAGDGWEAPLARFTPRPGASAEPVILAHELGTGPAGLSFCSSARRVTSLARAARDAGFDVWLLAHRGDRDAVAPDDARGFDFDDIAAHDVPAAIDLVRRATGAGRVLWVGHGLGGLLLYAHAARTGGDDLAAGVALAAPVRFEVARTVARAAAMAAHLIPPGWNLPTRAIQRALAPFATPDRWTAFASGLDGPTGRGLLWHAGEDVHSGLVRQAAKWLATGRFCDRHDRFDYAAALHGANVPLMAVAGRGDRVCTPESARPALDSVTAPSRYVEAGHAFGHLDLLLGAEAPREVFPEVLGWLDRWRTRCSSS